MTAPRDNVTAARPLDTALLIGAIAAVLASLVAYYYFDEAPVVLRAVGIIAGLGSAAALAYRTRQGQLVWDFIQGSRIEIRKVVWPTRQETMQTTLAVFLFILALGIFFWGLDFVLLLISRTVTGQEG